jgi:hypothetical protein
MKIHANTRLKAASKDREDAARYRAIRERVMETGTITLKRPKDEKAFDEMIDKVLRS